MSFRLWTIFYVFALLAAAMATFGPAGIVAAAVVLGFWVWQFYRTTGRFKLSHLIVLIVIGLLIALVFPVTQSAREAALRLQCANNLKQISLAILNYESANRVLPPAYTVDANGKPMHSWRVLILPYLGENLLYSKYKLNEPWNGPNNSKLAGSIPQVYRCPSHWDEKPANPAETNYFVAVGTETAFPGSNRLSIQEMTDGTSKTITVVEGSGLGVNWMEPQDLTFDDAVNLLTTTPRSGHRHVRDGFLTTTYYETSDRNVARCDGSVLWMGQLSDPEIAKALLTANGGEHVPHELAEIYVKPKSTSVVKWGKAWALCLFIFLALLPLRWAWQRGVRRAASNDDEPVATGEASIHEFCEIADANAAI